MRLSKEQWEGEQSKFLSREGTQRVRSRDLWEQGLIDWKEVGRKLARLPL